MTNPGRLWTRRRSGELLGYQSGPMARGTQQRQFAGQRMLVGVGVFAVGVLAIKAVGAVLTNMAQLVAMLVPLALILGAYLLIYRLILGRWAGTVIRGVVRTGTRISAVVAGTAARPSGANSLADRVRAAIRAGRVVRDIPVRHFQIRPLTGGPLVPCLLRGEPDGAEPQDGDMLRLLGRTERSGDFVVQRIEVLAPDGSGAARVIRGRLVGSVATTLWRSRLCYVASAVVGVWAAVTLIDIVI